MDEKFKKIDSVPKRKVYTAWVLVLALAALLIGLSLFLQQRASAAVQIQLLDSSDLESLGAVTDGAVNRCSEVEKKVNKYFTTDDIVRDYIDLHASRSTDKTTFSESLRTTIKRANNSAFKPADLTAFEVDVRNNKDSQAVLEEWADCLDGVSTTCDTDSTSKISALSTEITNAANDAESTQIRDINNTQTRFTSGELTSAEASTEIARIKKELQGQEVGNEFDFGSKLDELASLYDKCSETSTGTGTGAGDGTGTGTGVGDTSTGAGTGTAEPAGSGESTIGNGMNRIVGTVAGAVGNALDGFPGAKELRRLMKQMEQEMLDRNDSALRVHEYNVGLLRRAGIRQAVESLFSAIKAAGSGDWGGVLGGLFDAWDGYAIAKYAPDFLAADKPMSREMLQSTIDLANAVGDTDMLSQFMGGGSGVFGSDGSISMPHIGSDGKIRFGEAVDAGGAISGDFQKELSDEQLETLKDLQTKVAEAGEPNGFLRDTDKDGVPDQIASDCSMGEANCFYYQKVDNEYLFMPAQAVLQLQTDGGIVELFVARNASGKVYPFFKGPAKAIDKIVEQMTRMVFQQTDGAQSIFTLTGGSGQGSGAAGSGDCDTGTCPVGGTDTTTPPQPPIPPTSADTAAGASSSLPVLDATSAQCPTGDTVKDPSSWVLAGDQGTRFQPTNPSDPGQDVSDIEKVIANNINDLRSNKKLTYDPTLASNARKFAEAMIRQGCLSHQVGDKEVRNSGGNENLYMHTLRANDTAREVAELKKLLNSQMDSEATDAVDFWNKSPLHNANMLDNNWGIQGIGVAIGYDKVRGDNMDAYIIAVALFNKKGANVTAQDADSLAFWFKVPE